ncbi:MAG: hypothetical protein PQJ58_13400 [Spirochaetales bacterium]|nr:hypothetical protein [Spirochaetales bacterium]
MGKKIIRGISEDFAEAFKCSILYRLYREHEDEIIIGIRNDYLNMYYNSDSIAKIEYINPKGNDKKRIVCEIDEYYLYGSNSNKENKRVRVDPVEIYNKYPTIKELSKKKKKNEKITQSLLVLNNNRNQESNWYCLDIEYVKAFKDQKEKNSTEFNARFDIIALSKQKPHKVALIELKYGTGAMGEKSGIRKHVSDFYSFIENGYYESHLRQELIEILKSLSYVGISLPFNIPESNDLLAPEFYFITLDNNAKGKRSTPKQVMAGYLFEEPRWGRTRKTSINNVEKEHGDITRKGNKFNAKFLFSKSTVDNMYIQDIIDGNYEERIVPD